MTTNPADLTDEELDRLDKNLTAALDPDTVYALIRQARRALSARENQRTMIQDHMEELVGIATELGMGPYVPIGDSYLVDCHADQIKAKCKELVSRVGELESQLQKRKDGSDWMQDELLRLNEECRVRRKSADQYESQLATLRAEGEGSDACPKQSDEASDV